MSVIEVPSAHNKGRTDVLDLAEYSSAENFMSKIFQKEKMRNPHYRDDLENSFKDDNFDKTSYLIETASQAIEALSNKCDILLSALEYEKTACAEQKTHIEALKKMLNECKAKISSSETDVKSLTLRCQAAEARVVELENSQKVVTLRASKAESISSKLQQQVEAAFGHGSPIRLVMDSVKPQEAAE